ncbi:MAG: hypothetical protein HY282_12875 [Nitrospirae bacterium]|nr:hypothetical protein [Candidatus Manganitrophaceae bacterium]
MSQRIPRFDLPDLLYWEIMEAAEQNKRTLAEEIISRLLHKPDLSAKPAGEADRKIA